MSATGCRLSTYLLVALIAAAAFQARALEPGPEALGQGSEERDGEVQRAETGPGMWRKVPTDRIETPSARAQRAMIERLQAIGYMSGSTSGRGSGVTRYEKNEAALGLNFYTSGHDPGAILMDMEGHELYRWHFEYRGAFPDSVWVGHANTEWWRRAHLFENGDVLAIFEGFALIKIDEHSKLIWANPVGAHHDLEVLPNGDIYVLTRIAHRVPRINDSQPVLEDFVTVLSPEGEIKKQVSLLRAFENSDFKQLYLSRHRTGGDLFHTNSVEVLDGRIADRVPAFQRGRILTSVNNLSVVAVVDLDRETVVWAHKGGNTGQHDAKILDNGHLMLFDNRGVPGRSGVMEFDLGVNRLVWQYRGSKQQPFFSRFLGAAQRLANGNTLITESEAGRAFEVTPEKKIVWEFYNPHRAGESDEHIATIFEMQRLPPEFPVDWIPKESDG